MLACVITQKVLFARCGNSLVKRCRPTNDAIFINMYFGKTIFFEQGNNTFSIKLLFIMQYPLSISADKSAVIL